jgi:hypothetical protein
LITVTDPAQRRAELERWIADSRRLQKRLVVILPIGLALAIAVRILFPGWAWLMGVATVAFYGVGRYITWVHITDWQALLRDLDRAAAPIAGRERDL